MTIQEYYEELKKVPTKKKRKMLCQELRKNRKFKEYTKLLFATDEEVESVFEQVYNHFCNEVILESDYE